jgi:hypothetical protein
MALSPVGVLTRDVGAFFLNQMMGGYAPIAATGGATTYCAVYNNDTAGNYLWILGLQCAWSAGQDIIFEIIQGNPGGTPVTPAAYPIVSNGPIYAGQLQTFYSSVCIGNHIGGAGGPAPGQFTWPHEWPVCVVAPGQAFAVQTGAESSALSINAVWYYGPQP